MKKKSIFIKLRSKEDIAMFERFKQLVNQNDSDITKTTKRLWRNYIIKEEDKFNPSLIEEENIWASHLEDAK